MIKLFLACVTIFVFISFPLKVFADNHSISNETATSTLDTEALEALILLWESQSDLLTKADVAKQIQEILGVKIDGLVGIKTITAIKRLGISKEISPPSREENSKIKSLLDGTSSNSSGNSEGSISVQRAEVRKLIEEIKEGSSKRKNIQADLETIQQVSSDTGLKQNNTTTNLAKDSKKDDKSEYKDSKEDNE